VSAKNRFMSIRLCAAHESLAMIAKEFQRRKCVPRHRRK
jgi:hypothetical protein